MTLMNTPGMFEAPFITLAASDMFKQASIQEPPAKRLKVAPDPECFQDSDPVQGSEQALGPLQCYTLQKLQRVTLNSSQSKPPFQPPEEGTRSVSLEEPTTALDSSTQSETQTERLDTSKGFPLQLPSSAKPLLRQPKVATEPVRLVEPAKAPDAHLVTPPNLEGSPTALDSSVQSECPKKDELPDATIRKLLPQFSIRQVRTKRGRGRRHLPGSCIDLTQSDDEGLECSRGTVEALPVQAPREGLRETPAREETRRWRQLEGKVCTYPLKGVDAMAIHGEELQCLAPGAFLNDTIIEFYMRWLQVNWPCTDLPLESCLFLNSFFYKKLKQLTSAQRAKRHPDGPDFHRLRRWTRGIDLLRKQYIFVPIHDQEHWTLAVVCFPEERALALPGDADVIPTPSILHLDSLGTKQGGHTTASVTRQLKSYLAWEVLQQLAPPQDATLALSTGTQAGTRSHKPLAKARPAFTADQIVVKRVPVPLQQNDYDCGLFLLHSLETFVAHAPATFRLSDLNATLQFGRTWYPSDAPSLRRFELLQLLQRMFGIEEEPSEVHFVGTTDVTHVQAMAPSPTTLTSPGQEVARRTDAVIALRTGGLASVGGTEIIAGAGAGHEHAVSSVPSQAPDGSRVSEAHPLGDSGCAGSSCPDSVPPERSGMVHSEALREQLACDAGVCSERQKAAYGDLQPECLPVEAGCLADGEVDARGREDKAVQSPPDRDASKAAGEGLVWVDKDKESAMESSFDGSSIAARLRVEMRGEIELHRSGSGMQLVTPPASVPSQANQLRQDVKDDPEGLLLSSALAQETCLMNAEAETKEAVQAACSKKEAASLFHSCAETQVSNPVDKVHPSAPFEVAKVVSFGAHSLGQHIEAGTGNHAGVCAKECGKASDSILTLPDQPALQDGQMSGILGTWGGGDRLEQGPGGTVQQSQCLAQSPAAKPGQEVEEVMSRTEACKEVIQRSSKPGSEGKIAGKAQQGPNPKEVSSDAQLAFDTLGSQPDANPAAARNSTSERSTEEGPHDSPDGSSHSLESDESDVGEAFDADSLGALVLISTFYSK